MSRSKEVLQHAFQQAVLQAGSGDTPTPAPPCTYHYHLVYSSIHSQQTYCATCGTTLKYTQHRKCPNPDMVEGILKNTLILRAK